MNKETQELIKYIENFAYDDNPQLDGDNIIPIKLGQIDCILLLDYINNLQEENKKLNNTLDKIIDENVVVRDRLSKAIEELELWQPKIEALKIERDYLLDILRGEDNESN